MLDFILRPWHLVVLFPASHLNRRQERVIGYLQVENQVLCEQLGKKRILLNDDQRRRLAVKGKALGRKVLRGVASIVSPDTILRWPSGQNIQLTSISCWNHRIFPNSLTSVDFIGIIFLPRVRSIYWHA
jgi:hypothetical protein